MIRFELYADGTKTSPIILTAQDPDNPPLLKGTGNTVLSVTGNYLVIDNIKLSSTTRGLEINNASYNIIRNVEIFKTGSEGVLIRGTSTHNLFQNCFIHNTGTYYSIFGDGLIIGTKLDEPYYTHESNYNIIEGCIFRDIPSEPIKINVYSTENEIVGNTFFGDRISGRSEADSFVNVAGYNNYIHDNVAYRNLNQNIVHAFKVKKYAEDSGD